MRRVSPRTNFVGQLKFGPARELGEDLLLFLVVHRRLALGGELRAGHAAQVFESLARHDLARERIVQGGKFLFLEFAHLDGVFDALAREVRQRKIGRRIHAEIARFARRGTDQRLAETGQERLRPELDPEVFPCPKVPWARKAGPR